MIQRKKQPVLTRQAILDAAGVDFSVKGFAGTGLGGIVARAELTKGGLFHHFADKRQLGAAWITERLGAGTEELWAQPLAEVKSLEGFRAVCRLRVKTSDVEDTTSALIALGAEMAGRDEGMSAALAEVFSGWRASIAELIQRGKKDGWIHGSIKPEVEAAFLVSSFAGFTVAMKISPTAETRASFLTALEGYLETLRAA